MNVTKMIKKLVTKFISKGFQRKDVHFTSIVTSHRNHSEYNMYNTLQTSQLHLIVITTRGIY